MCAGNFTTKCHHELLEAPVHSAFPRGCLSRTASFSSLVPFLGPVPPLGITACSLPFIQVGPKAEPRLQMGNPSKQHSKTFVLIWTILYGRLRICNYSVPIFHPEKSIKNNLKKCIPLGWHCFWKHFLEGRLITSLSLILILRCLKERNTNKIQKHRSCFYLCLFHRNNFKLKGMKGCGKYWKVMNQFQSILIPV